MEYILILLIGYLLGCLSPAAWISKQKDVDLRKEGSGNLGATNTALVLGSKAGIFVLILDMGKSILSAKISKLLFPQIVCAGLLAGIGCILGHCFPVFMNFQGGKGLASFGGMILIVSPMIFVTILIPCLILVVILNTSAVAPMLSGVLFPVLLWWNGHTALEVALGALAGMLIIFLHRDNLKKALTNTDVVTVAGFWERVFGKPE